MNVVSWKNLHGVESPGMCRQVIADDVTGAIAFENRVKTRAEPSFIWKKRPPLAAAKTRNTCLPGS